MKRTRRLTRVSAKGRRFLAAYTKLRLAVLERDGFQCRACGVRAADGFLLETHHVVKRSHDATRKADAANLITLCQACHRQTDAPYRKGRLVITPKGDGWFDCDVVYAKDKFEARRA